MYDVNKTGVLTKQAIDSIFSTLENHQPLWNDLLIEEPFLYELSFIHSSYSMKPGCPENCYSNEDNNLTLTGWISEWSLMMHLAPQRTVNTIIALGYNDDPTLLYTITRPKEYDWEKYQILRRNIVHAFLFGEKAVGKVSIDSFLFILVFITTTFITISFIFNICSFNASNYNDCTRKTTFTEIRREIIDFE